MNNTLKKIFIGLAAISLVVLVFPRDISFAEFGPAVTITGSTPADLGTIYVNQGQDILSFMVSHGVPTYSGGSSVNMNYQICDSELFVNCASITSIGDIYNGWFDPNTGGSIDEINMSKNNVYWAFFSLGLPYGSEVYMRVLFEEAAGETVSTSNYLTFTVQDYNGVGNDAWDPGDDTGIGATGLAAPGAAPQSTPAHTITGGDIYDWYSINMDMGTEYSLTLSDTTGSPWMFLYSDNLGSNLEWTDGGTGTINFNPVVTSNYFLSISCGTPTEECSYTLNYSTVAPEAQIDQWDNGDDSGAGATPLGEPTLIEQTHGEHSLSGDDEYDWFSFSLTAGSTYTFSSSNIVGSDLTFTLCSESACAMTVASAMTAAGNISMEYTAENTATYYLRVKTSPIGMDSAYTLAYIQEPEAFALVSAEACSNDLTALVVDFNQDVHATTSGATWKFNVNRFAGGIASPDNVFINEDQNSLTLYFGENLAEGDTLDINNVQNIDASEQVTLPAEPVIINDCGGGGGEGGGGEETVVGDPLQVDESVTQVVANADADYYHLFSPPVGGTYSIYTVPNTAEIMTMEVFALVGENIVPPDLNESNMANSCIYVSDFAVGNNYVVTVNPSTEGTYELAVAEGNQCQGDEEELVFVESENSFGRLEDVESGLSGVSENAGNIIGHAFSLMAATDISFEFAADTMPDPGQLIIVPSVRGIPDLETIISSTEGTCVTSAQLVAGNYFVLVYNQVDAGSYSLTYRNSLVCEDAEEEEVAEEEPEVEDEAEVEQDNSSRSGGGGSLIVSKPNDTKKVIDKDDKKDSDNNSRGNIKPTATNEKTNAVVIKDVNGDHFAKQSIERMKNALKSTAKLPAMEPEKEVSRGLAVDIVINTLNINIPNFIPKLDTFPDVKSGEQYSNSITIARQLGIVKGQNNGAFNPERTMTRAEFITLVSNSMRLETISYQNSFKPFKDIPSNNWAYDTINRARALGLIKGYENGDFGPNDPITSAQMTVILDRAITLKSKKF